MKNLAQITENQDIITKEYLVAGYEPLLPATPLDPGTKYLNGSKQWSTIPIYTHPTTAGNKHIPTGGASGQILRYSASGTAIWGADNDTITTINGKTGAITKADITALGIPAQDTVVDISGKADITYVDGKVKTDVPVGAKFTDTVYTHPASHPASMITGLPTSLPANGGNADTVDGKHYSDIINYVDSLRVPNLTLNELTLGGRFKIVYNDIEDSLDIEVI